MSGGIIQKLVQIIKGVPQEVLVVLLVCLVGMVSFFLGRMSVLYETRTAVSSIEMVDMTAIPPRPLGGMVVGSKTGSKYHFPWCPGALQIAEKNQVWFTDEKEARRRGYAPAGNCKGLE